MKFVELVISPSQRYAYKAASDVEMNILGDFLASDVGYRPLPFKQWAFDHVSQNAQGSLTALEKNADSIILTDVFTQEKFPTAVQMTHDQFVRLLTDWQEKVCNLQPKAIVIERENNKFIIKTKTTSEDSQENEPTAQEYPSLTPHVYPTWIKASFITCCILLFIRLFDFPYYFRLNHKVKKARKSFENKDYITASSRFKKLHKEIPQNRCFMLHFAQSLFKSEDENDHMIALNTLNNIELKRNEWNELVKYMPSEYVQYFHNKTE